MLPGEMVETLQECLDRNVGEAMELYIAKSMHFAKSRAASESASDEVR